MASGGPVAKTSLYVSSIPNSVDETDFSRHFLQLDGCLGARLRKDRSGQPMGFIDFATKDAALAAKDIYNGWQGWDSKGLHVEIARSSSSASASSHNKPSQARLGGPPSPSQLGSPHNNMSAQQTTHVPQSNLNLNANQPPLQLSNAPLNGNQLNAVMQQHMAHSHSVMAPPGQLSNPNAIVSTLPHHAGNPQNAIFIPAGQSPHGTVMGAGRMGNGGGRRVEATSNTLYVEHVPYGAQPREIAHIFRPFPGYRTCRVTERIGTKSGQPFLLCFAEFDSPENALVCLEALQGYIFDLQDDRSPTLRLSFSRSQLRNPQHNQTLSNHSSIHHHNDDFNSRKRRR